MFKYVYTILKPHVLAILFVQSTICSFVNLSILSSYKSACLLFGLLIIYLFIHSFIHSFMKSVSQWFVLSFHVCHWFVYILPIGSRDQENGKTWKQAGLIIFTYTYLQQLSHLCLSLQPTGLFPSDISPLNTTHPWGGLSQWYTWRFYMPIKTVDMNAENDLVVVWNWKWSAE